MTAVDWLLIVLLVLAVQAAVVFALVLGSRRVMRRMMAPKPNSKLGNIRASQVKP